MNASGCKCTTQKELEELNSEDCSANIVITKSCTLSSRTGNTVDEFGKNTKWFSEIPHGTINSNGLCNLGIDFYIEYGLTRNKHNKQYYISVAGTSLSEKITILRRIVNNPGCCDLVELNFSCPNIKQEDFLPEWVVIDEGLKKIEDVFPNLKYGVKLPPLFNKYQWRSMANVLNNKRNIMYVSCCNSIPNGYFPSDNGGVIEPRGGFGGIGGLYLKPISLANVKVYNKLLHPKIIIYGCGGVKTPEDVMDFKKCGAAGVQIGSWLMEEGSVADKFNYISDNTLKG